MMIKTISGRRYRLFNRFTRLSDAEDTVNKLHKLGLRARMERLYDSTHISEYRVWVENTRKGMSVKDYRKSSLSAADIRFKA